MRIKPLLLVLPLLWYLSGVSSLAAAVCVSMPAKQCCCCQRAGATDHVSHSSTPLMDATASRAVLPGCPCKVAPRPEDPRVPATASTQAPDSRVNAAAHEAVPLAAVTASHHSITSSSHSPSGDSPPYLTAANPRC